MPVVPSDHGLVKVYTRSPWASSARRSSATAPRAVYRIRRSNWSRRCAGTWVLACSEKPLTLAQRGPVSAGDSPSYPKPEPIRRTCCPARSPGCWRALDKCDHSFVAPLFVAPPRPAPPCAVGLQAAPAGGGGARGGTPAPEVRRGRRRGDAGQAGPTGRREKAV